MEYVFTPDTIRILARPDADPANINSIYTALVQYGPKFGLMQPHRLAQYVAQLAHESGGFKYDKEIWGPTAAQARYDTRTDLGNTPELDGDGAKYRGRTAMQLTGKSNYKQFYDWCATNGFNPPNFVVQPELVNNDPWEGLVPIWYWDSRNLNKYADEGDNEMITRRINGGLNGFEDRLNNYTKFALLYLGFTDTPRGITQFQTEAAANGLYKREVDGKDGPGTRSALHQTLVRLGTVPTSETKAAPVTEPIPVAPQGAQNVGVTRTLGIGGVVSMLTGFLANIPDIYKVILVGIAIVAIIVIVLKAELIARRVKAAIKAFGFDGVA